MTRWWTRRSLLQTASVTGFIAIAGCSTSRFRAPPPKPRVDIQSESFEPDQLVIDRGETVTWWNIKSVKHTVTTYEERIPDEAEYFASGGFDSEAAARDSTTSHADDGDGMLEPGDRFEHRFTVPGYYHYCCIPHENSAMVGTIIVRTDSGEIPSAPEVVQPDTNHVVQMGEVDFYPESLTIHTGDSVGWVNGTGIAHSVTGEAGGDVFPNGPGREFPKNGAYFASGGFDSADAAKQGWETARRGDVLPNKPFVHTFEEPGTYPYLCILHPLTMLGAVNVLDR